MAKKEKKEKVRYYDDGRTIADMSGVQRGMFESKKRNPYQPRSTFKEKWNTYWSAVRMVFPTMVTFLIVICTLYIIMYLLLQLF